MRLLAIFLAGTGIALTCVLRIGDEYHPTVVIGLLVLLAAVFLRWNHLMAILRRDKLEPLWVTMPYLVILASAVVSHLIYWSANSTQFLLLAVVFGLLYLLGKDLGKVMLWSLPLLAVATSVTLVATLGGYYLCGISHVCAFVMVMGALVTPAKYRWLVLAAILPGLAFSKSEEGLLALGIIAVVMLLRKDWSIKVTASMLAGSIVLLIVVATGYMDNLFPNLGTDRLSNIDLALHGRWTYYTEGVQNFIWYGAGWVYSTLCLDNPWEQCCVIHNVPFLISTQLGVPAGLAWLGLMLCALWKTPYKYLFAVILGVAMIDHMFWTFLMVMPWLLIGVAANESEKDYIFKEVESEKFVVQPAMAAASAMDGG